MKRGKGISGGVSVGIAFFCALGTPTLALAEPVSVALLGQVTLTSYSDCVQKLSAISGQVDDMDANGPSLESASAQASYCRKLFPDLSSGADAAAILTGQDSSRPQDSNLNSGGSAQASTISFDTQGKNSPNLAEEPTGKTGGAWAKMPALPPSDAGDFSKEHLTPVTDLGVVLGHDSHGSASPSSAGSPGTATKHGAAFDAKALDAAMAAYDAARAGPAGAGGGAPGAPSFSVDAAKATTGTPSGLAVSPGRAPSSAPLDANVQGALPTGPIDVTLFRRVTLVLRSRTPGLHR